MYSRDVVQIESKDFVSNQHNSGLYHWNTKCKCNKSYKSKKPINNDRLFAPLPQVRDWARTNYDSYRCSD